MNTNEAPSDKSELSLVLGPLPETDVLAIGSLDMREDVEAYSPEAMETERQRCYALGAATMQANCIRVCEQHAADKTPPHKAYENTYCDGWLDATNECKWEIEKLNSTLTTKD